MTKFLIYFTICLCFLLVIANPLSVYAIPKNLSENAKPLTPDQTQEIEKDPEPILAKCMDDLAVRGLLSSSSNISSYGGARLGLCDSFAYYLKNKCKNFEDLLQYCEYDPSNKLAPTVDKYEALRLAKLTHPLNIEVREIKAKNVTGLEMLTITFSIINPNLLDAQLVGKSFDVLNENNLIHSSNFGEDKTIIPAFSAYNVTDGLVLKYKEAGNIVPTNSTWRLRGSIDYGNFTSGIVSQPFDITTNQNVTIKK